MPATCTALTLIVLLLATEAAFTAAARVLSRDAQSGHPARGLQQLNANCSRVHPACATCRNQRVPGTVHTVAVCSSCAIGWRLRRDGKGSTCDCAPGLMADGAGACVPCTRGLFCTGGDARNPDSTATACPPGLATRIAGAKSQAQCFTAPGHGRVSSRGDNGAVVLSSVVCPPGTYNVGGNSAGCQPCGQGLTTAAEGASSAADCVAPPGRFLSRGGVGVACPIGTFSTGLSRSPFCTPCPDGTTTPAEGANVSSACSLAIQGFLLNADGTASRCPANTYSDVPHAQPSCTPCPFGLRTREDDGEGASGPAACLAPPGYELLPGASEMSVCEVGWFKDGWSRAACVKCGDNLDTAGTGSVSRDACRVPPAFGIVSMSPMAAQACRHGTFGTAAPRPAGFGARCRACPSGMVTSDTLTGEPAPLGYTSESDCLLRPGWGSTATMPAKCPRGSYNPGGNRLPCTSCPAGYTTAEEGAVASSDCFVKPGWQLDTSRTPALPAPCTAGSYSTGGSAANPSAECVPCPSGFTTAAAESTSLSSCSLCTAGHGGAGCELCPHDTFASGGAAAGTACTACAAGTVSTRGAASSDECCAAMVDPSLDVFLPSDEAAWTTLGAATTSGSCLQACVGNGACVQYRFSPGDSPVCQVLLEDGAGSQQLGFKVADGAAFAFYSLPASLGIGAQVGSPALAGVSRAACIAACTTNGACEAVSFTPADGGCKLLASQVAASWSSMFHVVGSRLVPSA